MTWLIWVILISLFLLVLERVLSKDFNLDLDKYYIGPVFSMIAVASICVGLINWSHQSDDVFFVIHQFRLSSFNYWDLSLLMSKSSLLISTLLLLSYGIFLLSNKRMGINQIIQLCFLIGLTFSKNIDSFGFFSVLLMLFIGPLGKGKSHFFKLGYISICFTTLSFVLTKSYFFQLETLDFDVINNQSIYVITLLLFLGFSLSSVTKYENCIKRPYVELIVKPTLLVVFILKFSFLLLSYDSIKICALFFSIYLFISSLIDIIERETQIIKLQVFSNICTSITLLSLYLGAGDLTFSILVINNLFVLMYFLIIKIFNKNIFEPLVGKHNKTLDKNYLLCLGLLLLTTFVVPFSPLFFVCNQIFNKIIQNGDGTLLYLYSSVLILCLGLPWVKEVIFIIKGFKKEGKISMKVVYCIIPLCLWSLSFFLIPDIFSIENSNLLFKYVSEDLFINVYPVLNLRIGNLIFISILLLVLIKFILIYFIHSNERIIYTRVRLKNYLENTHRSLKAFNVVNTLTSTSAKFLYSTNDFILIFLKKVFSIVKFPFYVFQNMSLYHFSDEAALSRDIVFKVVFFILVSFAVLVSEF